MKKRGFTLIEMMVVISIIMILSGMTLYGIQIAMDSAKRGDTRALCMQVRDAVSMYFTDCKVYPTHNTLSAVPGQWIYELQRMGKKPPYLLGLDDEKITLSGTSGEIFDHYGSPLHFQVVGAAGSLQDYYRVSNTLKTFYVWSRGPDQVDNFSTQYTLWNTPSTSFTTFAKLDNPEFWADSEGIDDIIVSN